MHYGHSHRHFYTKIETRSNEEWLKELGMFSLEKTKGKLPSSVVSEVFCYIEDGEDLFSVAPERKARTNRLE